MVQFTINADNYVCDIATGQASTRIIYLIYPAIKSFPDGWLENMASEFNVTLAAIYIPAGEWNNSLTPWPEAGETPASPPFGGQAEIFLGKLKTDIIPAVEKAAGLTGVSRRDLIGVSLSGLFTLWQWLLDDTFHSIGCLSGSFWYAGFMDWFNARSIPRKQGSAYFLLGTEEPKAYIKAYRTVGTNTVGIVNRLQSAGIPTTFQWVPGNHFADPLPRAMRAIKALA